MTMKTTTVIAVLLISGLLPGCAGSGRFTRQQYAQLASDPFVGSDQDGPAATTFAEQAEEKLPQSVPQFAQVAAPEPTENASAAERFGEAVAAVPDEADRWANEATAALSDVAEPLINDVMPVPESRSAGPAAEPGFGAWLEGQQGAVVQASAEMQQEFSDFVQRTSGELQKAEYTPFAGDDFDSAAPDFSADDGVAASNEDEDNPFAGFGANSGRTPETATATNPPESSGWKPPAGFQFPD